MSSQRGNGGEHVLTKHCDVNVRDHHQDDSRLISPQIGHANNYACSVTDP